MGVPIFTDTFDRSDSAAGGVANSWVDADSRFSILSNALYGTGMGQAIRPVLLRPAGEARVGLWLRGVTPAINASFGPERGFVFGNTATGEYYDMRVWGNDIRIYYKRSAPQLNTTLASTSWTTGTTEARYIDFSWITDGTTSTLTLTVSNVATGQILGSVSINDTSAGLQGALRPGVRAGSTGTLFSQVEIYDPLDGPPAYTQDWTGSAGPTLPAGWVDPYAKFSLTGSGGLVNTVSTGVRDVLYYTGVGSPMNCVIGGVTTAYVMPGSTSGTRRRLAYVVDPARSYYYSLQIWGHSLILRRTVGNTDTTLASASTPTDGVSRAYRFTLARQFNGDGTVTLTGRAFAASDPATVLQTVTYTDNDAALLPPGYPGHTADADVVTWDSFDVTLPSFGSNVLGGSIAPSLGAGTNHRFTSSAAGSGGTAPLSYSWYRGTSPRRVSAAEVAGATGATLDVAAPSLLQHHYWRRTTDATGKWHEASSVTVAGRASWKVAQIGDSITEGSGSNRISTYANLVLASNVGARSASLVNFGKAGGTLGITTQYGEFFAIGPGYPTSNYELVVVPGIASNACNCASVRLGTNNAAETEPVAFGTALDALIGDLLGRLGLAFVILHYPTYAYFPATAAGATQVARLASYLPVIDARINGRTVLLGDTQSWERTAINLAWYQDDVHFLEAGTAQIAEAEADAVSKAIDLYERRRTTLAGVPDPLGGGPIL